MRLHNNMMSLNVFKNYQKNLSENALALGKISSGSKIMSAKDNPNKIAQNETFKLQIRGLNAARRNVQDGVSMMQTAQGGTDGVTESLIRMRELVIQAGTDTMNVDDKAILQKEIDQIKSGINDLAKNTEFNGVKLLGNTDVIDNESPISKNMAAGINSGEDIFIPSFNLNVEFLKDASGNKVSDVDVVNGKMDDSLSAIDAAIKTVSDVKSKFGALSNRFESLSNNQESMAVMLEGASASIAGADIAKEMIEFTRTNILIEASNYMMAQTNELPNEALRAIERI